MKFMILMYSDPAATKQMSAPDLDIIGRKHAALRTELTASGELLNGAGLAYPQDTRTIRLQDGTAVTRNGSFLSGNEQLTAYYVVECASLERAESIASGILDFHVTAVEVRQVHDSTGR